MLVGSITGATPRISTAEGTRPPRAAPGSTSQSHATPITAAVRSWRGNGSIQAQPSGTIVRRDASSMSNHDPSSADVERLLLRGADLERKLFKRERRAERELAALRAELVRDQARLERARSRLERRVTDIARAEAALRARQEERATGRTLDTPMEASPASLPPPADDPGPTPRRRAVQP